MVAMPAQHGAGREAALHISQHQIKLTPARSGGRTAPVIGHCVYCGSTQYDPKQPERKLGDEHMGANTDRFGTFSRDIERTGSQLDAARAKIAAGFEYAPSARIGLASEGSFGPIVLKKSEHHAHGPNFITILLVGPHGSILNTLHRRCGFEYYRRYQPTDFFNTIGHIRSFHFWRSHANSWF